MAAVEVDGTLHTLVQGYNESQFQVSLSQTTIYDQLYRGVSGHYVFA
jgi:hypothetical protein